MPRRSRRASSARDSMGFCAAARRSCRASSTASTPWASTPPPTSASPRSSPPAIAPARPFARPACRRSSVWRFAMTAPSWSWSRDSPARRAWTWSRTRSTGSFPAVSRWPCSAPAIPTMRTRCATSRASTQEPWPRASSSTLRCPSACTRAPTCSSCRRCSSPAACHR